MNDDLEEIHFKRVLRAFSTFSDRMKRKLYKHYDDWNRLGVDDQELIPEYKIKLDRISEVASLNQFFFDLVVSFATFEEDNDNDDYNNSNESLRLASENRNKNEDLRLRPTDRDYENLRSTLRQLVRDWSDEGKLEREACYRPILNFFNIYNFGNKKKDEIKVLVPGAGLGRLAWEINRLGFNVQGNEFSLYMLLTSQLILNDCKTVNQHQIHPFSFPLSNHTSVENSLRAVRIPDVTADSGGGCCGDFSMTAGDFIEIYSRSEEISAWDCIVTCFFLDTAQNVLEYLRVIRQALRPGGQWINLGPLQYHFESAPELSIELTWQEIVRAAQRLGFIFTETKISDDWQPYANDQLGLSRTVYRTVFSVATNPC